MGNFHFRASNSDGHPIEGEMAAHSLLELESRLEQTGLWLIRAREIAPSQIRASKQRGRVKSRDLMEFSTHMFTLLDAGVSLPQALKNLVQESANPNLRSILQTLYHHVEAGSTLYEAMGKYPKIFPPQMVNLIQAGEESGTLTATFQELERYLNWLDQIRGDVRQATIYPSIVLVAVIGLLGLLFTFVIPRFVPILKDLNVPLPALTRFIIGISELMVNSWWIWGPIVCAMPFIWLIARKLLPGYSTLRDHFLLRIPILGELIRMLTLSKFVQNFAVLYRAGIPVLQCLQLCQGLVGNAVVARALKATEQAVAEGSTINESLGRHPIFPPMMIQMISVGESTGKLPQTLMNVANFYNREIPRRVKKIFAVFEPAVTLVLISIVGAVALALFMPMMSIMDGFR
ncbi:MAG: type II secretion system F family protein [Nitrospirales bacterium]